MDLKGGKDMERRLMVWIAVFPLFMTGSFALMISIDNTMVEEADGLLITGPVTWNTDRTFNEDVTISSGGSLTIAPGVEVKMGGDNRILVNDGSLIIRGNKNNKVYLTMTSGGPRWGGIQADEDSNIVIYNAEIKFAAIGMDIKGTGHSATLNSLSVNDTRFLYCATAVILDADGQTGPFKCTFRGNRIEGGDEGIRIINGYSDVAIENNEISYCNELGIFFSASHNLRLLNNTITVADYGIQFGMMSSGRTLIENNTIWKTKIGLFGAFISESPALIRNNSLFCTEKGIYMGLMNGVLIENNTVTVLGDRAYYPIEVSSGDPPTVIKDNILSACYRTMLINGTAENHTIYNNLLVNLTDQRYLDNDGDGFCDADPMVPGTAGAIARNCRTSVHHMGAPAPSTTYVNPAQAAEFAPSGSKLKMITNPAGFGPKGMEKRYIYHTEMPVITRPMHLIGEEGGKLFFNPGPCMDSPRIENTHHAGIHNVTVDDGIYTVWVKNSHNISFDNIRTWAYEDPNFNGFDIDDSNDVTIEDCEFSQCWNYCINVSGSRRVTISDIISSWAHDLIVYIQGSEDVLIDNVTSWFTHGNSIVARRSEFHLNGSRLGAPETVVDMIDCPGSSLTNSQIRTGGSSRVGIKMVDSPGTHLYDLRINSINITVDHTQILMEGDCRRTVIDECIIYGNSIGAEDEVLIKVRGNFTGSRITDTVLWHSTTALDIRDLTLSERYTDIHVSGCNIGNFYRASSFRFQGQVSLDGCRVQEGEYGLFSNGADLNVNGTDILDVRNYGVHCDNHGGLSSDLRLSNTTINNVSYGIRDYAADGTDSFTVLYNVTVWDTEYSLTSYKNTVKVTDSDLSAENACMYLLDTDGSGIEHTVFHGDVPISLDRLPSTTRNTVILDNCTGNYEGSEVLSSSCRAVWTWPLDVHVTDEVGAPQPSNLTIESMEFGEVFDGAIDGDHRISLIGYFMESSGGSDVSDYTVNVSEGGTTFEDEVEMLSWQELFFMINHAPQLTALAPESISFDEDESWNGDISGWFTDRDALSITVESKSPTQLHVVLDEDVLSVAADEDWNGEGQLQLLAVDTYDAEVHHTLDVQVLPVNDPPYLTDGLPELNTSEDTPVWMNLSGYGADIDSADLTWTNLTAENCTISWDMMNMTVTPAADWYGSMNITLKLSDGEEWVLANLTLNVAPVNDPPVWTGDPVVEITVQAGETYRYTASDKVEDVDNEWTDMTASFDPDNASLDENDIVLLYPAETENMTETITVTISDGEASTSFQLLVTVIEREPEDEWEIIDADVVVDEGSGNWSVEVEGSEGQDIYIVIEGPEGTRSYKLEETEPGHYEVEIPGDEFEEGETYQYHFSDTEGREDMTGGAFTGSMDQPFIGDDDDDGSADDDGEDDEGIPTWFILLGIILVLLVVVIGYIMMSKRGPADYYEEEMEEDEFEE